MAWTAPMTWTDGSVLTAAQLNLHLRDNLLETLPAKATAASRFYVANNRSHMVERNPGEAFVNSGETRNNEEYGDLATVGPTITRVTGPSVLVIWGAAISGQGPADTDEAVGYMSVEIARSAQPGDVEEESEGVVLEADDAHALIKKCQDNGNPPNQLIAATQHMFLQDLGNEDNESAEGGEDLSAEYTFTCKYRSEKLAEFDRRSLFIWPMS